MSPTNLGDLPSNEPAPTGLVQLKRGVANQTDGYTNNNPIGTVLTDGAGGRMEIAITPARPGWWLIRAENIIYSPDAIWTYCYWEVFLTPNDADNVNLAIAYLPLHSALSWNESCIDTAHRLNAGVAYKAQMRWRANSGYSHGFWTGPDYCYIMGEFVEDGSP
jgi:hypothetical protein